MSGDDCGRCHVRRVVDPHRHPSLFCYLRAPLITPLGLNPCPSSSFPTRRHTPTNLPTPHLTPPLSPPPQSAVADLRAQAEAAVAAQRAQMAELLKQAEAAIAAKREMEIEMSRVAEAAARAAEGREEMQRAVEVARGEVEEVRGVWVVGDGVGAGWLWSGEMARAVEVARGEVEEVNGG